MSESHFLFVTDASARQINAHASRVSLQAKKRRGKSASAGQVQHRITRGGKLPWVQRPTGEEKERRSQSPSSDPESTVSSAPDSDDVSVSNEDEATSNWSCRNSYQRRVGLYRRLQPRSRDQQRSLVVKHFDPISPLGAGRVDPFDSFPIRTNAYISQLIDHFVVAIPDMMFGVDATASMNTFLKQFKELALDDGLAMQALIMVSATQFESLRGTLETASALTHKSRTLALLRQRLKSPEAKTNNGTLWSVSTLAAMEELWSGGNVQQSWAHYLALKQLVKLRGGLQVVADSSPLLLVCLVWNFATASREVLFKDSSPWVLESVEAVFQPHPFASLSISWDSIFQASFAFPNDTQVLELCEDLVSLFQFFEMACLPYLPHPFTETPTRKQARLQWAKMISPTTPLYLMFSSPYARDKRQGHPDHVHPLGQDEEREKIGYTEMSDQCRLWSLLILNLMLWIHRDSPLLHAALSQIEEKVQMNHPQFYNRFETLAAMLIGGDAEYELFDPKLIWYASRVLSVTKLLSPYNWKRVAQRLMEFLIAFASEDSSKVITTSPWEDNELRNDIVITLCSLSPTAPGAMSSPL